MVADDVRRVGVKLARSLQLSAIGAFALAVIALAAGESIASTVLFTIAAIGFLAALLLQRRR